ncbi:hypothetical protein LCGC14_2116900, partial [marine sediment metagenome]
PHKIRYLLQEALTTSDFPLLFGDVLDRQLLASYKAVPPVWKAFVRQSTVPRIYPQVGGYRFAMHGGDQFLAEVAQKGEYLASDRTEERYPISVRKYGRQFDISWETMINDDLGALKDTPNRFAMAAMRTEHRVVTAIYASDVGAHAANANLYQVGVNAAATLLSINALEVGIQQMNMFTDEGGEPILATPKYLVVPPALEFTARQILTSATKHVATGVASVPYPTNNVVSQLGLTLIVDKYLPIVNTGNDQHTQWYLFSDPSDIAAIEAAHLTGHERPEIAMKASDKVTVGGGAIGPMSGDFATDNVFYRVRLVFGSAPLDWRATYMGGYLA